MKTKSTFKKMSHLLIGKILIGIFAIITFANTSAKAQNCTVTFVDSTSMCDAYFYGTPMNAGNGINWTWNFGDGNIVTGPQYPVHTYAQNGTYYVCVTIYSANGGACQASYCDSVVISGCNPQNGCNADFNYSVANCTVYFSDMTQPTPTDWWWDFGDGGTSILQSPSHTYPQSGLYTVCLTSYDSLVNCYDTICKQVQVNCGNNQQCNADFTFTVSNCTANFTNTSNGNANSTVYQWSFGDNNFATGLNQVHQYSQSGTYTVCLTMTDSVMGCSDSICKQVTVNCGVGVGETYRSETTLGIYPNPFTSVTTITYSLTQKSVVKLEVMDVLGNKVVQIENEVKSSGNYQVSLNADKLSSGMYFVKITVEGRTSTQKIVLDK